MREEIVGFCDGLLVKEHGRRTWVLQAIPITPCMDNPWVYVEFISASDVAECSSGAGEAELAIIVAPDVGPS